MVVELQMSYLTSMNACSGVKMQQFLHLRFNVYTSSYTPAAYLLAVVKWKQRKHPAQFRTETHRMAVKSGRNGAKRVERERRLCHCCKDSSFDDVEHMTFDCAYFEAKRLKHQSLFAHEWVLADILEQDSKELAAFVHDCTMAC